MKTLGFVWTGFWLFCVILAVLNNNSVLSLISAVLLAANSLLLGIAYGKEKR